MLKIRVVLAVFIALSLLNVMVSAAATPATEDDDDDAGGGEADDDGRVYKNPRNSPSAQCPRDEDQATILGQKCLRKCSSDEDCKSKKKKCLCDGACGMSCIKPDRECPELEQPDLGTGTVTVSGRLFGDKAVYTCQHGYHVVGLQSRNCQADGQWAGQPPACKMNIYCLQPPTIEHARHSALPEQATFDLDATVQYHCHTGYTTNGFPRAKCLAIDGQASWYGPDISCEPRSCGPPGDVPHGWVTAECHTFGCRALLRCGPGFELVGKDERFCQADGTWAPKELPTCVLVTAVQCAPPEAPRHGKAVYTSCAYNSVVSYECKYGYRLVGDATRRCGADKKWSGAQPSCKEINCGHPGQLWNGWLENISSGTGLGASIIFRCHDGMRMEGNASTICQNDGTWRYPLPKCLAPCVVPHVTQGKVVLVERSASANVTAEGSTQIVGSSSMVQHGDIILVECETNYEFPSSNAAVTCNNGTWTQIPRCQPARCKKMPRNPRNGMVLAPKTEHGMKARFRCKDGYVLVGNPVVNCSYGNWTGPVPTCDEVYCPFPGYIDHGKVLLVGNMGLYDYRPYVKKVVNNKQIMYDCDKGYVLAEGPPGATCIGGYWRPLELPRCVLGQHPRIRWSRRRRSLDADPTMRHKRSAYLRQYYNQLRLKHIPDPTQQHVDELYDKYNPTDHRPTLRHANYKLMKKLDIEFGEDEELGATPNTNGETDLPTAIYTVYNVNGEPIGHRLYSYQPVYEPEEDEIVEHDSEDEEDATNNLPSSVVVLKGGVFADNEHLINTPEHRDGNINKLKHQYFVRYVDKRRKRFSSHVSNNEELNNDANDIEPEVAESKLESKIILPHNNNNVTKAIKKGNVNETDNISEEFELENQETNYSAYVKTSNKTRQKRETTFSNNHQPLSGKRRLIEGVSSFPLKHKIKRDVEQLNQANSEDLSVIPLPKKFSNHTEETSDDSTAKRDKRTSRKTDRLNQTTATVPKTGRDSKGGKTHRQQETHVIKEDITDEQKKEEESKEETVEEAKKEEVNQTERGIKKGRTKIPCEPISSEPYVNIEIVKLGRDPNITYSSGTIVRVACGKGYEFNLEPNATAKCVRGRWKPEKPKCEIIPCHIPATEYGIYSLAAEAATAAPVAAEAVGAGAAEPRELNDTDDVQNGQVVHFSCEYGYNVQGPSNLRCWHGEWAVTSLPECIPAPCELPAVRGGGYEAGYRAGLTVAHASSVSVTCEEGHAPPGTLNCHLGRLQPSLQLCQPLDGENTSRPRSSSGYLSGSDIVREDITELEPDLAGQAVPRCGPPARIQGTLIYRDGTPVNGSSGGEGYPHGTEVTFRCIASIMGEKTTWKIICEHGEWIGKSFNCEEMESQLEGMNNSSCTFRNEEPHVTSFYRDLEITEEVVDFPIGAVIVSRCSDIGKYAFSGSTERKCLGGEWDGMKPTCFGLNQENDYAMEKPPTILFRHQLGPIAQSNEGRLLVYPGTVLHMECLWMRRFGNPKWNITHRDPQSSRKYPEGWTTDPGRDSQLEYRLSIINAVKEDSGVYRCDTPARQFHQVEIIVEDVHCPPLPLRRGLIASSQATKLGTEVRFSCANGNALLGAQTLHCRASGNWSAPLPVCESVECGEVAAEAEGAGGRRPRVTVVSRGVGGRAAFSCAAGWGLRGPHEAACLPSGEWARPFPTCVEVSCPALPPPTSGYVLGRAPYRAGDVLQFHCNPEHTLHGRPILVCQDSGRWSDRAPTCAQACTYPGTTISGRMSSVKFYYKIGESITFTCEPGYQLRGAPMLRCLKNRKWSNAIPLCVPLANGTALGEAPAHRGDGAMQRDAAAILSPADILRRYVAPAALSPESHRVGATRAAAIALQRRAPTDGVKARILRVNKLLRREGNR